MKNIDLEISEKVAKEASRQINEIKQSLNNNRDNFIDLLSDIIKDNKEHMIFLRKLIKQIFFIIFIAILGIIGITIFYQMNLKSIVEKNTNKIIDFVANSDFESSTEIMTDNNSDISGYIIIGE